MTTATQTNQVLAHLKAGHTITFWDAVERFGIMHLPRRILDIRELGHVVESEWVKNAAGKRFKKYWLSPSEGN